MQAFLAEIIDIWDAGTADQDLVRSVLIAQLWCIAFSGFKLDCDLLVVKQVRAFEDDTERALSYLLADAIMHTNNIGRGGRHAVGVWGSNGDLDSAQALFIERSGNSL